jgi:phosphoglycolate phosphatase-like HAD superfamily hydrolase
VSPSPEPALAGRTVVVTSPEPDRAGAAARVLEAEGARVVVFVGDVTDDEERAALVEMVAEILP